MPDTEPDRPLNAVLDRILGWVVPAIAEWARIEVDEGNHHRERAVALPPAEAAPLQLVLQVDGHTLGRLSLASGAPIDRAAAEALATRAALTIDGALLRLQLQIERGATIEIRGRLGFLAEASRLMAESLKLEPTLATVARLCVPTLADWSAVVLVPAEGELQRVAVETSDPQRTELASRLLQGYHMDPNAPTGIALVLRTGQPAFLPEIPPDFLSTTATDEAGRRLLEAVGLVSFMCVPLVARGRTLGTLTLGMSESNRRFTQADLDFALEIGRRAGVALENARLYTVARDAIELRDEFLSIASHELKTPITGLSLSLESLQRLTHAHPELVMKKLNERVPVVLQQMNRLNMLVERLLDVSQLAGGKLKLLRETVDPAALVREIVSRFTERADLLATPLQMALQSGLVGHWDRLRLDQAITNLVDNALKYGHGRPVQISVEGTSTECLIRVRDEGIGIAPKDQERVFGRYERAVPLRQYGGLGLGLWITHQIVTSHDGHITLESAPGRGATFTLSLPLAAPRED